MNKEDFWDLIESVNKQVPQRDHEQILARTKVELCRLSQEDILDWHLILDEYREAAKRNDLCAASAAMGAHVSDDGFADFRSWLVSCGRSVYMAALGNPDTLAAVETKEEDLNFELYGYVASDAFSEKQPAQGRKRKKKQLGHPALYVRLGEYELDPATLASIRSEITQRPDIAENWSTRELPKIFPRLCAKKIRKRKAGQPVDAEMEHLINTWDLIYARVCERTGRSSYVFEGRPENIASFIGARPHVNEIVLTDRLDMIVLSTIGFFIDYCPDKILLEEVKKKLVPIQLGEAEPTPFFCPSVLAVARYCE